MRAPGAILALLIGIMACRGHAGESSSSLEDADAAAREEMVRTQMEARGITDPRVLSAMRRVPRHRFIPEAQHREAYADRPLPIGHGQTISQPYIVAFMSELARIEPGEKVLEIGTGSGYQAAILAAMGARVWSIEIVEPLARGAARLLAELGWGDVQVRHGDGYLGWPEHAPFDAILLTAAPLKIPEPLREQLAVGGRLVAPVGRNLQQLVVMTRTPSGYEERIAAPVRFVPMTGAVETAG